MNSEFSCMKVKDMDYSRDEVLKTIYYFQNKSFIHIIWAWILLRFGSKVEVEKGVITYT